jgi:uncharacterized RDD family membrane protein YckC
MAESILTTDESKPQVAGFSNRLVAHLIDIVVLFPAYVLIGRFIQCSRGTAMLGAIAYGLILPIYNIVLLGLFGQTLGKKAAGIRVKLLDNSEITWTASFLRHSIDLLFAIILIVGWMSVLSASRISMESVKYYTELKPSNVVFVWASWLWTAWLWSELVVMLLNARRRALHDFLAETWVIQSRLKGESIAIS